MLMLEDDGTCWKMLENYLELKGRTKGRTKGQFQWSHVRFESPFGVRLRPHWSNLTIELRAGLASPCPIGSMYGIYGNIYHILPSIYPKC